MPNSETPAVAVGQWSPAPAISRNAQIATILAFVILGVRATLLVARYLLLYLFGGVAPQYLAYLDAEFYIAIALNIGLGVAVLVYGLRGRADTAQGVMGGRRRATLGVVVGVLSLVGVTSSLILSVVVL